MYDFDEPCTTSALRQHYDAVLLVCFPPGWSCCQISRPCTRLASFCRRRHKIDPKDVIAGSVFSVSNSPATFRNPMHDDAAEQERERQATQHRRQGKLRRKLSNLLRLAYNVTKAGRHATSSTRRSPPPGWPPPPAAQRPKLRVDHRATEETMDLTVPLPHLSQQRQHHRQHGVTSMEFHRLQ